MKEKKIVLAAEASGMSDRMYLVEATIRGLEIVDSIDYVPKKALQEFKACLDDSELLPCACWVTASEARDLSVEYYFINIESIRN
jgi:hypothetical protein